MCWSIETCFTQLERIQAMVVLIPLLGSRETQKFSKSFVRESDTKLHSNEMIQFHADQRPFSFLNIYSADTGASSSSSWIP